MTRTLLLLTATALVGCSEFELINNNDDDVAPGPDILVTPPALTYSLLADKQTEVQTFTVENIGEATLHVTDVVVASGIAFTVLGPDYEFDLEPGESKTVDVEFTPMGADENFGQVHVLSDDGDTPEAPVDLLGYGAVPELSITPDSYNFGATFIPCGDAVELTLENIGTEALVIDSFDYRSGGDMVLDASALDAVLPLTLQPGETFANVWVTFEATTKGSDTGTISVFSNDPRGEVTADQNGEGAYYDETSETFTEPGIPPVDVIMAIDNSCSMEEDNEDDIENGIPDFVTELQNVSDWQLIQVTKENGCANGGVLDSTMNTSTVENTLISNAFNSNDFNTNTEKLLKLADVALGKVGAGQCNEGFLRPGALLHIITFSDEKEQSNKTAQEWVDEYEGYVSDPSLVKVSAVADLNKNCGDGSGAKGYEDAADITGGAKLNICNANWGSNLKDIASEVLAGIRTYNLTEPAIESSIDITVNGAPATDWEYNSSTDSITINEPPVGEGDEVIIDYAVNGECN